MSSNVALTIQQLKEQEMERYRDLFHTMFKKVNDKIKTDVRNQLPRGIYYSSIRLPSVPAFSGFTTKPTPPQEEVDAYIIGQLEKRNLIVTKQDAHYIRVDWSSMVSQSDNTSLDGGGVNQEHRNKEKAIALLPKTDVSMILPPIKKTVPPVPPRPTASLPPPPRVMPKMEPKAPLIKNEKTKIVAKNVPILSNKVPRLDSQIEKKMATSHQHVLRALAGV